MFSFGWSEIALTVIIVIIVVGPKEIPNLLRQLGNFSKSLKKISREFKSSLNDLANESDLNKIKKSIIDVSKIKDELNISRDLKEEIKLIKDTAKSFDKNIKDTASKINKE